MRKVFQKCAVLIAFTLFGCQTNDLAFQIRFDEITGLKRGDSVFFEGSSVGEVKSVSYTKVGDYLVEVQIQPNFVNAATRDSQFYITDDPQLEGKKAIEIVQEKAGGEVLSNGEIVAGSVRPTILRDVFEQLQKEARRYKGELDDDFLRIMESLQMSSQELEDGLEESLADLARQLSQLFGKIQQVPDSQELKALKDSLGRLSEEMARVQGTIREKIKNELIPEIQKRLNKLREGLERYNRQDEIDPLDRQLNEIRKL